MLFVILLLLRSYFIMKKYVFIFVVFVFLVVVLVFVVESGFVIVIFVVVSVKMLYGEIKKVDILVGKLIIKYGFLENLGMDGMMMVFCVKDLVMF